MRRQLSRTPSGVIKSTFFAAPATAISSSSNLFRQASSSPSAQQSSMLDASFLGLTSNETSFLLVFSKEYQRTVTDTFLPTKTIGRQCKYTVNLHRQLTELAQRSRVEKFIPKDCIDSNTDEVIASRLIVSTAFSDRTDGSAGGASSARSKSSSVSIIQKQQAGAKVILTRSERNKELLNHTRRLAVEHFNWSYYWRSLAFDAQDEAATEFCNILISKTQDLSFFLNKNQTEDITVKTASLTGDKKKTQEELDRANLEEAIKKQLRDYAMNGGAVSQGGSWTWLVWNPFNGTSFSSSNRYGLEAEVSTSPQQQQQSTKEEETTASSSKEASTEGKKNEANEAEKTGEPSTEKTTAEGKGSEKKSEQQTPAVTATKTQQQQQQQAASYKLGAIAGRLEVINTPFDVCPIEYGLFPILCINMTQRGTLASPVEWATVPIPDTIYADNKIPSWSRAARNSAAIQTRGADLRQPGYQAFEPLTTQRKRFVDGVVNNLNWTNAVSQLEKAMAWNESKQRRDAMYKNAMEIRKRAEARAQEVLDRKINDPQQTAALKEKLEKEALLAAQREIQEQRERDENEAKMAREQEEAELEKISKEESSAQQVKEDEESKKAKQNTNNAKKNNDDELRKNPPTFSKSYTPAPSAPLEIPENSEPQVATDGSLVFSFPEGHIRYDYPDGRKTIQFNNGTLEWWTSPDGAAEQEEENARTILQRQYPTGELDVYYVSGYVTKTIGEGEYVMYDPEGNVYTPPSSSE